MTAARSGVLDGSVAAVVGGATGIGRGVVDRFVAEGARVAVLDLDPSPLAPLAARHPDAVVTVTGDAGRPGTAEALVDRARHAFGALDTLVCCAGRFDFHAPVTSLAAEALSAAFDELFAVNVKSAVLAARAAAPELRRQAGSIVLTLSSSAFHPEGAGPLYGASKWALRGLVVHLARELAPDIRVNGVAPGGTTGTALGGLAALGEERTVEDVPGRTARLADECLLRRAARPADHAGPYVFLAAPALSGFVNATVVRSDGGRGAVVGTAPQRPQTGSRPGL